MINLVQSRRNTFTGGSMSKLNCSLSVQTQKIREQIIKTGEELLTSGLIIGTWGNISRRLPEGDNVLITPSGMSYNILKPADLIVVGLDGEILSGDRKPTTEAFLHLAIYRARPDVMAVVHTHSTYASAYAVARTPLPPVTEELAQIVGGAVEVAGYALPGTAELAENAVAALGNRNAVLLANHGVVGVGPGLSEAITACRVVEKTAQVNTLAKIIGTPVELDNKDVIEMHDFFLTKYGQK